MGSFLLLLVAEVLPKIKLNSSYELQLTVLGAIISLGLAIAVAIVTPPGVEAPSGRPGRGPAPSNPELRGDV